MKVQRVNFITCITAALLTLALWFTGCGGNASPAAAEDSQAQPSYATADELLAHVNDLLSRNPIDSDGLAALYYIESELQRRLFDVMQSLRGFDEMQHRVFEVFGGGLHSLITYSPLAPLPPAAIIDRSPQRALARTTLPDDQPYDIYLVMIDDEWRISGFTLERVFENPRMAESLADIDGERISRTARSFMARIDRGEFETLEEVRAAWIPHVRSP